jgi:hypothetical protein
VARLLQDAAADLGIGLWMQHFDGDRAIELLVMGRINNTQATLAQPPFQAVARQPGQLGWDGRIGAQEIAGLLMRLEKRAHLAVQGGILPALPDQECLARGAGRKFQRAGKQGFSHDRGFFHRE